MAQKMNGHLVEHLFYYKSFAVLRLFYVEQKD